MDVAAVDLDGSPADADCFADLGGRQAIREQQEDLALARGEPGSVGAGHAALRGLPRLGLARIAFGLRGPGAVLEARQILQTDWRQGLGSRHGAVMPANFAARYYSYRHRDGRFVCQ